MNHSEVPRLPFLLAFLVTSLAVLSSTYADSLFLSTYPRNWLTYYFIANPVVTIILFFFINPFLSRATPRQSFGIVLVLMAILGTCYALMFTYSYIMPFILCLLLTIFSVLINIMAWSAISSAFDIREYKKQSFKLNICATMSVIISAFLMPLAVH
ncbi:MAG TPA: hypothetical protein DDY37_06645, partial [Legionella sp.]|nr:hypothetical protein [Legionella sp.]